MRHLEIEQKYRIQKPDKIRSLLKKLGAKKLRGGQEYNEIWDRKGELRRAKKVLRLRHWGKKEGLLTLKGPRQKAKYSKRLEIETEVTCAAARLVLKELGYYVVRSYEKTREEFRMGKALVTIDHLDRLGWFVEIEGNERTIQKISAALHLKPSARENRTYLALIFGSRHERP